MLFSGNSNLNLTNAIAKSIDLKPGKIQLNKFSDGENNVKILENVRGTDVFVVQSLNNPVNDHIMELLLMLDAFKRASARRVTVVIPFYGYARQDRKVEPRVPISAKVVARVIEIIGANRILCMDLHSDQIQGYFEIPVDHLFSAPILVNYFKTLNLQSPIMVSPDSGGANRARFFAKQLGTEMAIVDKRREKANESEVMNIVGDIKDKTCILIDDMIDTAGTICKAAQALKEGGALSVIAGATHAVLSGNAAERLCNSVIEKVVVTNTIHMLEIEKYFSKLKVLSVAGLIGEAIQRIHEEKSVSSLFLE